MVWTLDSRSGEPKIDNEYEDHDDFLSFINMTNERVRLNFRIPTTFRTKRRALLDKTKTLEPSAHLTLVVYPFLAEVSFQLFFLSPNPNIHNEDVYSGKKNSSWRPKE